MTDRYDALTVRETNGKSYFTKIGAAFKNRSGNGYTLMLDAVPASNDGQYRILLTEPKEREERSGGNGGSGNASRGRATVDDLDDDVIPYMRSDGMF